MKWFLHSCLIQVFGRSKWSSKYVYMKINITKWRKQVLMYLVLRVFICRNHFVLIEEIIKDNTDRIAPSNQYIPFWVQTGVWKILGYFKGGNHWVDHRWLLSNQLWVKPVFPGCQWWNLSFISSLLKGNNIFTFKTVGIRAKNYYWENYYYR